MTSTEQSSFHCISPADAVALIRSEVGTTVFDVRNLASYQRGHIDGAAHLTEQRLPLWLRRLPKDGPVLIYCYHGNVSKTYAQTLSDFRFARVFSVDGGYEPLAAELGRSASPE